MWQISQQKCSNVSVLKLGNLLPDAKALSFRNSNRKLNPILSSFELYTSATPLGFWSLNSERHKTFLTFLIMDAFQYSYLTWIVETHSSVTNEGLGHRYSSGDKVKRNIPDKFLVWLSGDIFSRYLTLDPGQGITNIMNTISHRLMSHPLSKQCTRYRYCGPQFPERWSTWRYNTSHAFNTNEITRSINTFQLSTFRVLKQHWESFWWRLNSINVDVETLELSSRQNSTKEINMSVCNIVTYN